MRILVISSYFPYPLHAGGYIRLYNLLQYLSKNHEITLIAEKRSRQQVNAQDIQVLKKFCKEVVVVPTPKQWSWQNIVKTSISTYPFLLTGHTSVEMKQRIVTALQEKTYDLIHVETFYVMQNLPKSYLPIVLAEHNIEHQVYRKYVAEAPLPLRPLLLADIEKMKYWEKKFWQRATKLIAVSQADKMHMGREDVAVVPNGVDTKVFSFTPAKIKQKQKEKRILFIGDFRWIQNRNAAQWILNEIWPKIEASIFEKQIKTSIKLWIVGKHIPQEIKARECATIIIDENAPDDTAKIYHKSFLLLAPLRVGGGTSYKILESMASGVAVVTTEMGIQGIGARDGQEALVAQTTDVFAKHVLSLLDDESLYKRLTGQARVLIEDKFSWEKIGKLLENVYVQAVEI